MLRLDDSPSVASHAPSRMITSSPTLIPATPCSSIGLMITVFRPMWANAWRSSGMPARENWNRNPARFSTSNRVQLISPAPSIRAQSRPTAGAIRGMHIQTSDLALRVPQPIDPCCANDQHASAARPPICVRSGSVLGESGSQVARGAVAAILLSPHEFVALTRRKRDGRGVVCHDDLEIQHTLLALETLDQTPRRSDIPVVRNDGGDSRSCYGAGSFTSGLPKRSYSAAPRTKNPIDVKKTSPSCQAHTNSTMMAPSAARNSGRTV